MKIINHSFTFTQAPEYAWMRKTVEDAARNCYQSESKGDPEKFLRSKIKLGHTSILEHVNIGVHAITDRGVSHEWVRHRVGSAYSQESTRYANYAKDKFGKEITVVHPVGIDTQEAHWEWKAAMEACEFSYMTLLEQGVSAQNARSVLPNSLATSIHVTHNINAWRHFFYLRTAPAAHPDMRYLACEMLAEFKERWPVFFEDLLTGSPAEDRAWAHQ